MIIAWLQQRRDAVSTFSSQVAREGGAMQRCVNNMKQNSSWTLSIEKTRWKLMNSPNAYKISSNSWNPSVKQQAKTKEQLISFVRGLIMDQLPSAMMVGQTSLAIKRISKRYPCDSTMSYCIMNQASAQSHIAPLMLSWWFMFFLICKHKCRVHLLFVWWLIIISMQLVWELWHLNMS